MDSGRYLRRCTQSRNHRFLIHQQRHQAALTVGYFLEVGMRDIKFRIWDGNNKKYDYPEIIELNKGLEYEQFTGLRDIDGNEIYEGDHLMLTGHEEYTYIVTFESSHTSFALVSDASTSSMCGITVGEVAKRVKIIGNIHEGVNQ